MARSATCLKYFIVVVGSYIFINTCIEYLVSHCMYRSSPVCAHIQRSRVVSRCPRVGPCAPCARSGRSAARAAPTLRTPGLKSPCPAPPTTPISLLHLAQGQTSHIQIYNIYHQVLMIKFSRSTRKLNFHKVKSFSTVDRLIAILI